MGCCPTREQQTGETEGFLLLMLFTKMMNSQQIEESILLAKLRWPHEDWYDEYGHGFESSVLCVIGVRGCVGGIEIFT